jgi:hypothetical protein
VVGAMSTSTPNSVEQLVKLWRDHDVKASSPEAIRAAKEKIRDFFRKRGDGETAR